jgi:cytochrome c oxidase subunit 2
MKISNFFSHNKLNFLFGVFALMIILLPIPTVRAETKVVNIPIQASSFSFSPGTIYVNKGDQVVIELTSQDVVHGLHLEIYDLSVTSEPGQMNSISFIADKSGSFRFRCSVTCGALHPFMTGKLKVGSNELVLRGIALAILMGIFGVWRIRYD